MDSEGQAPGKHNIHNSKALSDPAGSQVPPLASPQIQQQQPQPSKYRTSSLRVRLQPGQRHLRQILDAAGGRREGCVTSSLPRSGWGRRSGGSEERHRVWDWNVGLPVRPAEVAGLWISSQGLVSETYLELCPFSKTGVRSR